MTPAVSVLLPTHNNAPHLEAAVRSVLDQTFTDTEVIVVDDASRDGTPGILARLAAQDDRVRVLTHRVPQGIEAALNLAARESRAPLLARMDGDDLSLPRRLERQVQALHAQPDVVALGAQLQVFGDLDTTFVYPTTTQETRAYALFACPLGHPAALMRRRAFVQAGGYRRGTPYSEDYALWARMLQFGELCSLPDTLLRYRRHGGSVSVTRAERMESSTRRVWRALLRRLGVPFTPQDVETHALLHGALYHRVPVRPEQRDAAERWAGRLLAANRSSGLLEEAQLHSQLERRLNGLQTGR